MTMGYDSDSKSSVVQKALLLICCYGLFANALQALSAGELKKIGVRCAVPSNASGETPKRPPSAGSHRATDQDQARRDSFAVPGRCYMPTSRRPPGSMERWRRRWQDRHIGGRIESLLDARAPMRMARSLGRSEAEMTGAERR